eukprot:5449-Heterococcus_DN1.PRE.3
MMWRATTPLAISIARLKKSLAAKCNTQCTLLCIYDHQLSVCSVCNASSSSQARSNFIEAHHVACTQLPVCFSLLDPSALYQRRCNFSAICSSSTTALV